MGAEGMVLRTLTYTYQKVRELDVSVNWVQLDFPVSYKAEMC
jgi:hypothetical protein